MAKFLDGVMSDVNEGKAREVKRRAARLVTAILDCQTDIANIKDQISKYKKKLEELKEPKKMTEEDLYGS